MKPVRVEVSMRLLIDATSYAVVGTVLDEIQSYAEKSLKNHTKDEKHLFSITGVNTYPCKQIEMNQAIHAGYPDDGMTQPSMDSLQPW